MTAGARAPGEAELRALLETVELQARQIAILRERLNGVRRPAGVTVRPPEPVRRDYAAPLPRPDGGRVPEDWPRRPVDPEPLRPNPGWACHTLKATACDVVGYSVIGLLPDEIERVVAAVDEQQRSTLDFVPVFLTDTTEFEPFRSRGYAFEHFPAASRWAELDGTVPWQARAEARLDMVRRKWGLQRLVRLGPDGPPLDVAPGARTRLLFFPDYSEANPYQRLMYAATVRHLDAAPGRIEDALILQAADGWKGGRKGGRRKDVVFHLHWEDAVYRGCTGAGEAVRACERFLAALERFVGEGGTFVWTIHNLDPHDGGDDGAQDLLWRRLPGLAHALHVHSEAAARAVRTRSAGAAGKTYVIPHGNYAGRYRADVARGEARRHLGIADGTTVFLFFGKIRAYKGVDELVDAFDQLGDPGTTLVVAGRQHDRLELAGLPRSTLGRLVVRDGTLPDDEVAVLFAAADFVVLPYRSILTSGSLMLALTLARPVVAPAFDAIAEVVADGREAVLYDPLDPWGLVSALGRAADMPAARRDEMARAAADTAARFDWRPIGDAVAALAGRAAHPAPGSAAETRRAGADQTGMKGRSSGNTSRKSVPRARSRPLR